MMQAGRAGADMCACVSCGVMRVCVHVKHVFLMAFVCVCMCVCVCVCACRHVSSCHLEVIVVDP